MNSKNVSPKKNKRSPSPSRSSFRVPSGPPSKTQSRVSPPKTTLKVGRRKVPFPLETISIQKESNKYENLYKQLFGLK
jgi:hypothetical protein